jgi:hypothetical protein
VVTRLAKKLLSFLWADITGPGMWFLYTKAVEGQDHPTMKMEAAGSTEMFMITLTSMQRHNPKHHALK